MHIGFQAIASSGGGRNKGIWTAEEACSAEWKKGWKGVVISVDGVVSHTERRKRFTQIVPFLRRRNMFQKDQWRNRGCCYRIQRLRHIIISNKQYVATRRSVMNSFESSIVTKTGQLSAPAAAAWSIFLVETPMSHGCMYKCARWLDPIKYSYALCLLARWANSWGRRLDSRTKLFSTKKHWVPWHMQAQYVWASGQECMHWMMND